MGIIPEDDEEKWGTGKYENLVNTVGTLEEDGRPDIEELDGYDYDEDDLGRASIPQGN